MASETHWAQVLPYGAQTGDIIPLSWGYITQALWTPFTHPVQGGGGTRPKNQEPSPLKDHLHTKFHPDPSSLLDFIREHSDRHTN